jgi:acetolactate decarboxylase
MINKNIYLILFSLLLFVSCTKEVKEITRPIEQTDAIFQYSTMIDLVNGKFEGTLTQAEYKSHGDFGIGTYNGVNGEMVYYEGIPYRVSFEGPVVVPPTDYLIPFANTKFFVADSSFSVNVVTDDDTLKNNLLTTLLANDKPAAIKISGQFTYLKTRSVPKQSPPYGSIYDVIAQQNTFDLPNSTGTIVGFWMPEKLNNLNFPGYHFHYLNSDFTAGGHVLEFELKSGTVEIDFASEVIVQLID